MNQSQVNVLARYVRQLRGDDLSAIPTDRELLNRYASRRDEAAFACLVNRHGALVWNVGRRALSYQDAEDVFQATLSGFGT
jgi:hypothetical protein